MGAPLIVDWLVDPIPIFDIKLVGVLMKGSCSIFPPCLTEVGLWLNSKLELPEDADGSPKIVRYATLLADATSVLAVRNCKSSMQIKLYNFVQISLKNVFLCINNIHIDIPTTNLCVYIDRQTDR